MKVTLDDIAKATGVSKSTVSRVVTGKGNVKPSTRAVVEDALREYGYIRRNVSLRTESACEKMILAISRDISNPSHVRYLKALMRFFMPKGYMVFAVDCGNEEGMELDYIRFASQNGFCGIFLLSYIGGTDFSYVIQQARCPVVLVNHYPRAMDLDVVSIDNYMAGHMAARYLLARGHRNIAVLGGPDVSITTRNRIWGFTDELREAGIEFPDSRIFRTDSTLHDYDEGFAFGQALACNREGITAVFATNSDLADGFISALLTHDLRIPQDVSVICTDNMPQPFAGRPSITTICHDDVAIATAAGEMLLERLKNPSALKRRVVYDPTLVEGDSVANIARN